MKNNQTVLEWLEEATGKDQEEIKVFSHSKQLEKIHDLLDNNVNEWIIEGDRLFYGLLTFLDSPAESVYMGEVGSLLLELRK